MPLGLGGTAGGHEGRVVGRCVMVGDDEGAVAKDDSGLYFGLDFSENLGGLKVTRILSSAKRTGRIRPSET